MCSLRHCLCKNFAHHQKITSFIFENKTQLNLNSVHFWDPYLMTSTIEGNNSVGSLLKPLLKKVTPVVGSRMLCMPNTTMAKIWSLMGVRG
jgi:hypothetical protein